MRITQRQLGRVEAACFGLETLTEKNDVGRRLVNTIREVVDDILADSEQMRQKLCMPGECGIFPAHIEEKLIQSKDHVDIIFYGCHLVRNGAGYVNTPRLICEHFGLLQMDLAKLMQLSPASLSEAVHGQPGPRYKQIFDKMFGAPGADQEA